MTRELTFADFYRQACSEISGRKEPQQHPGPIEFPDAARRRHFAIFGGTGVGKSRFLESLMTVDVVRLMTEKSQRGVGLLDVHGDIYQSMRARLAVLARQFPELNQRLVLIDPTTAKWTVKYNPLELAAGEVAERKADALATAVTTIYHDDPTTVVRMYRVAWYSFLALMLAGLSLVDLPQFLRHRQYRENLIDRLNHPPLADYWLHEFPNYKAEREAKTHIESTLNRLDRFVTDPDIEVMFDSPSTINFRKMLDSGAVVLVNAPKGILGEGNAYLLCGFVLAEFQRAAMSRVDLPESKRRPFTLFCDEFANYTTDTIRQIIAESRKVGLELGLAAQQVRGQLKSEALQSAVINTVQNILAFRLGYEDADTLVRDMFTPDLYAVKEVRMRGWEAENVYWSLPELWEQERRKLTQLPDRMLYWKRRGHPGSHLIHTLDVADIEDLPNAADLPKALAQQEAVVADLIGQPKRTDPQSRQARLSPGGYGREFEEIPLFEPLDETE